MENLATACDSAGILTRTSSDPNLNKHQSSLDSHCNNADDSDDSDSQGDLQNCERKEVDHGLENIHHDQECNKESNENIQLDVHGTSSDAETKLIISEHNHGNPVLENKPEILEQNLNTVSAGKPHTSPDLTNLPCQSSEGDASANNASCKDNSKPGKLAKEMCRTDKKAICQIPRSDISLLTSNWDSLQGMMKSVPIGETLLHHPLSYDYSTRSLHSKHGRHTASSYSSRDASKVSYHFRPSLHCSGPSVRSCRGSVTCHPRPFHSGRFFPLACPSPAPLMYQDDDGLPIPNDVVQQRLRQMEASYKQEVDLLRRQVWELQLQLEIRQYCAPPPEPETDYEDDFVSFLGSL